MARYKSIDRNPRLLPVVLSEQIQPGSFEFALDHLVDHELDLSTLDARFKNDAAARCLPSTVSNSRPTPARSAAAPTLNCCTVQTAWRKRLTRSSPCIHALRQEAQTTRDFVATRSIRADRKGQELKTNIIDPDSAKMATSKGVIQGYAAQAAVDSAHQIIVAADATGSGSEQSMLLPMVHASCPGTGIAHLDHRRRGLPQQRQHGCTAGGQHSSHGGRQPDASA